MLKRRQPKPRLPQITPRALQLFNELQTHERGTDVWYSIHDALHRELGAKIWEWPLDTRNGWHYWLALTEAAERRQGEFAAAK